MLPVPSPALGEGASTANGGAVMHAALQHVAAIGGQIVGYLKDLVRMPTVNPPGDHYEDLCLYAMERLRQMDCIEDLTKTTQVLVQVALTLLS